MRVSSHIICSALCVCCSLSLCCAADTNRDEGKRVSDASRESDIYIMYSVCVRWRHGLIGVKYAHANHARVQRPLFLSRARARVKDRNERRSDGARVSSVWRRLEENCVEEEEEERDGGQ